MASTHATATHRHMAEINNVASFLPFRVTLRNPRHSGGVTRVTQLSSHSLRACARRASVETYVPNVLSMLTSDTVTSIQTYQIHCAYAYAVAFIKSCVTSVTGLERLPK